MRERYKGWISRPPLLVYSSMIKHLTLAYMPCSLWRMFNWCFYKLNFFFFFFTVKIDKLNLLIMNDMCFYIKNDHATVELLNDAHKIQAMVYTRLSLIVSSMLSSCYYYLKAKGRVANYFCLVRVTMIALIMRIILAWS